MAMRVCSVPSCPELVEGAGKCLTHRREYERSRGTSTERGYDYKHRQLRKQWIRKVALGEVNCARCGKRISPLEPWDLDHTDDRTGYLGPSCRACNRATAGR